MMLKSPHSPGQQLRLTPTTTSYKSRARLTGHFLSNKQVRRAQTSQLVDRKLFMTNGKRRQPIVARVVSTFNQPIQPRSTTGMVDLFTTTRIDAVEANAVASLSTSHAAQAVLSPFVMSPPCFPRDELFDVGVENKARYRQPTRSLK